MTRRTKARLGAPLTVAVAVLLASVACGDDTDDTGSTTTTTTTTATTPATATTGPTAPGDSGRLIEVVVRGGSVDGGGRHRVDLNEAVRLRVTSDTDDEVHVHGYERRVEVRAGQAAELRFVADLPGVFEVELERSGRRLLDLEVRP